MLVKGMVSGAEDLSPVLAAVQLQISYLNIVFPLFSYLQFGGREIAQFHRKILQSPGFARAFFIEMGTSLKKLVRR